MCGRSLISLQLDVYKFLVWLVSCSQMITWHIACQENVTLQLFYLISIWTNEFELDYILLDTFNILLKGPFQHYVCHVTLFDLYQNSSYNIICWSIHVVLCVIGFKTVALKWRCKLYLQYLLFLKSWNKAWDPFVLGGISCSSIASASLPLLIILFSYKT